MKRGIVVLFLLFVMLSCSRTPIDNATDITLEAGTLSYRQYYCPSNGEHCTGIKLSGGSHTRCYEDDGPWWEQPECGDGWVLYTNKDDGCEWWFCYEKTSYCRCEGKLTNPKVLKSELR